MATLMTPARYVIRESRVMGGALCRPHAAVVTGIEPTFVGILCRHFGRRRLSIAQPTRRWTSRVGSLDVRVAVRRVLNRWHRASGKWPLGHACTTPRGLLPLGRPFWQAARS